MEKKLEYLQMAFKEEEIKHLKELYMARVSQVSPDILATKNSSKASRDTSPRRKAQELCAPREPEAPQQTSQSALNPRNTIPAGRWVGSSVPNTLIAPQLARSEHLEPWYQRGLRMAERFRRLA